MGVSEHPAKISSGLLFAEQPRESCQEQLPATCFTQHSTCSPAPRGTPGLEAMGFLVEGQSSLFFRAQMGPAAGFPPGRRVQKREESIQKENAFYNKWKSLKPDPWLHSVPQVPELPCERPFHLTLEMRNRVVFL